MLTKPDRTVLSAFSQLQSDQDFQIVLKYLRESLDALKTDAAYSKEEHILRWNQGAIQALIQITDTAENARELLHKFR